MTIDESPRMPTNLITAEEQRLEIIRSRIATALIGSQRRVEDVTLVAVSKGHPSSAVRKFYNLGLRHFGESYAQEFCQKKEDLRDLQDIQWHFIGHLQSNKTKQIAPFRPLVHSLDRLSLLKELSKFAHPSDPIHVLLQLQVDPYDKNKSGCTMKDAEEICQSIVQYPGIVWEGFMGIGPAETPLDALQKFYEHFLKNAFNLWEKYSLRDPSRNTRQPKISLGMSDDLEVSLRCGSNLVRIGQSLFGPRPTKNHAT